MPTLINDAEPASFDAEALYGKLLGIDPMMLASEAGHA